MKKTAFFIMAFSVRLFAATILFDNTHAQIAGSAHWTITTANSCFSHDLEKAGFTVNSINKGPLTFDLLKQFDTVIIPEPNNPFEPAEIAALKKYTAAGGGLFLVCDHHGADRNGNGWDAVRIYNEFVDCFGFSFNKKTFSLHPFPPAVLKCSLTEKVRSVGAWGATSIKIKNSASVKALFHYSPDKDGQPYIVVSRYGKGRVAAIGDSSPLDDGTKKDDSRFERSLYNNYCMKEYDHPVILVNLALYCAGLAGNDIELETINP